MLLFINDMINILKPYKNVHEASYSRLWGTFANCLILNAKAC